MCVRRRRGTPPIEALSQSSCVRAVVGMMGREGSRKQPTDASLGESIWLITNRIRFDHWLICVADPDRVDPPIHRSIENCWSKVSKLASRLRSRCTHATQVVLRLSLSLWFAPSRLIAACAHARTQLDCPGPSALLGWAWIEIRPINAKHTRTQIQPTRPTIAPPILEASTQLILTSGRRPRSRDRPDLQAPAIRAFSCCWLRSRFVFGGPGWSGLEWRLTTNGPTRVDAILLRK